MDTNNSTIVQSATTRKSPAVGNRPVAPWMPSDSMPSSPTLPNKNDVLRRYSAATIRAEKSPAFDDLPANPPLPENSSEEKKPSKMKKSETFYARFVKNVLSSGRRQSKDSRYDYKQDNLRFIIDL